MARILLHLAMSTSLLGLVACGGSKKTSNDAEEAGKVLALDPASGEKALDDRYANFEDDVKTDDEGRILKDSKRSQFEGKQVTSIGGDQLGKSFETGRYSKKDWLGTKQFDKAVFGGDNRSRWEGKEWFLRKEAREEEASLEGISKGYETASYADGTGVAREASGERFGKPSDVETDIRRDVFPEPIKISDEDYSEMTLEETRKRLGRD